MFYGSECWAVDKKIEQRMRVAEIITLRRATRKDRIGNEYVRGSTGDAIMNGVHGGRIRVSALK